MNAKMLRNRAIRLKRKSKTTGSYGKMMKTLLLQNQQIIIQQQNMMFMVMKQFQHQAGNSSTPLAGLHANAAPGADPPTGNQSGQQQMLPQSLQHSHLHQQQRLHQMQQALQQILPEDNLAQHHSSIDSHHNNNHHQQQQHHHHHNNHNHQQQSQQFALHTQQADSEQPIDPEAFQQQQLQENLGNYLTPAASEQDPITDKTEEELADLLESDVLLQNNILYNPQTDIGPITPYKSHEQQQQTPSYYSSGCESLNTPRIDQQQQAQQQQKQTSANISQNVVKNLADSFKSPTKPNINVQIVSGSASVKNNKAKIIQRMNISDFLRHVHPTRENKDD